MRFFLLFKHKGHKGEFASGIEHKGHKEFHFNSKDRKGVLAYNILTQSIQRCAGKKNRVWFPADERRKGRR